MITLPTVIALLAPAPVLVILDQLVRRLLARRRRRAVGRPIPAPQVLGPAAMPIAAPAPSNARATDRAAARRVA